MGPDCETSSEGITKDEPSIETSGSKLYFYGRPSLNRVTLFQWKFHNINFGSNKCSHTVIERSAFGRVTRPEQCCFGAMLAHENLKYKIYGCYFQFNLYLSNEHLSKTNDILQSN